MRSPSFETGRSALLRMGIIYVTYQDRDESDSPEEIVVTPEMVDAGLFELSQFDPDKDPGSEFVTRLFRAMEVARRSL